MTSSGSPITQVAEYSLYQDFVQDTHLGEKHLLSKQVRLRLRDERIDIDLETLVSSHHKKEKNGHDINLDS